KRRARQALQNTLAGVQALFGGGASPEERAASREERDRLRSAVDRLDERHRLPLVLFYEQELSAAEIAAVLDVSEGTVHSRLHYARQKLLRQLQPERPDEETAQEAAR
ncbi:MAG TPA: sigma-70 family RNA polymerase sigma factor, partial [Anaerolineaceae bacterium]|nr:sigma-70 family RNA polymerase sigma factor [Anaerolineaceae bacterium]